MIDPDVCPKMVLPVFPRQILSSMGGESHQALVQVKSADAHADTEEERCVGPKGQQSLVQAAQREREQSSRL